MAKRELLDTGTSNRSTRRDERGRSTTDRSRKATTKAPKGQGDREDRAG